MEKPYLIQRLSMKDGNGSFDDVLKLDYMGSSEFEWGVIPNALKILTKSADKLKISKTEYAKVDGEVRTGVFLITISDEDYTENLKSIYDESAHLKERARFQSSLSKDDFYNPNVWWDIENNVMWAIGKSNAQKIVMAIKATREKKIKAGESEWY